MNRIRLLMHVMLMIIFLTISLFTQTRNPDTPQRGEWDFQLKKIWEIEKAGDDVIGEVQNFCTAKDGRLYLADSKNCKIYIFSTKGKFISSFGEKGEGPGELRNYRMGRQLFAVNNNIIFADWGRIHYFTLDGKFQRYVLIPTDLKPRLFVSEDILISAPLVVNVNDPNIKKGKIILYNAKEKSKKIISEFEPYDRATASDGRQITVSIIIPNITPKMFVQYRDGKIVYGISDLYKINVTSLDGKEICSFSVDGRKQKKIPPTFKNDMKKRLKDLPPEVAKNIINGLPEKASFFSGIEAAKNGLIYVFISDPGNETSQVIDIFSPQGKYLYTSEIKVEKGHSLDEFYFDGDFLYISALDEEGTVKMTKYVIKQPVL
jgi:hypothetical protein